MTTRQPLDDSCGGHASGGHARLDHASVDHARVDHARVDRAGVGANADERDASTSDGIGRDAIAALVPHGGGMVLLERTVAWDDSFIVCRTRSHLDPANPLRRAGRLAAVCGIEYALQAAALHGGLAAGGVPQPCGFLATLRDVTLHAERLDDPALGDLLVEARLQRHEEGGSIYALEVRSISGRTLVSGRAVIALPHIAQRGHRHDSDAGMT